MSALKPRHPLVFVVMDGVGYRKETLGNAVSQASTPNLGRLLANDPWILLKAHGTAVGLPSDDDMGNSEVGHNAMGAGRVYAQGARLVNEAIASGRIFEGKTWKDLVAFSRDHGGAMHFLGLLSDGGVHSNIAHLKALLARAAEVERLPRLRAHILLDGRDVDPTSALVYVADLEGFMADLGARTGCDCRIASGGGRMVVTMDRYEADWGMVALGWKTHVAGEGRRFASAREAIETARREHPGILDQDLPAFVVGDESGPVGPIRDGDAVVLFNFRGDRAIEISRAFDEETFHEFPREPRPRVAFAGMLEYDAEARIPESYLVSPPVFEHTLSETLCGLGIRQCAVSETQKFGHVTYFWNGNRSGYVCEALEKYVEVPSDTLPFAERPWMKSAEITDVVVAEIASNRHDFIRLNYPNGDMVGHTGIYEAARLGVEAVDLALGRLVAAVESAGGTLVVTADHGNAEEMYEIDRKSGKPRLNAAGDPVGKTAHSRSPVWFIVHAPGAGARFDPAVTAPGLANVAATCCVLLGVAPPEAYEPSLILGGSL